MFDISSSWELLAFLCGFSLYFVLDWQQKLWIVSSVYVYGSHFRTNMKMMAATILILLQCFLALLEHPIVSNTMIPVRQVCLPKLALSLVIWRTISDQDQCSVTWFSKQHNFPLLNFNTSRIEQKHADWIYSQEYEETFALYEMVNTILKLVDFVKQLGLCF